MPTDLTTSHSRPPSDKENIRKDKILLVYENTPSILIANALGGIPLAVVTWNDGARAEVVIWIIVLHLTCALRALHYSRLNSKTATIEQVFNYGKVNTIFVAITGAVWGTAGILFFDPAMVLTYSFLILTLVCIISGSLGSMSSLPPSYPIFSTLTIGPLIILMALHGSNFSYLMSGGTFFYLIMTLIFSRNLNSTIEQSLKLKYKNLALVDSLKEQTVVAEKANHDKSNFLAAASHDLRQPLNAVNLFTEVLENSNTDQQQKQVLARMRRGLDSMGELFDALLDISRIDANTIPVNKSDVSLPDLMQNVIDQSQLQNLGANVTFSCSNLDHIVYTDPALLERILKNLLSNAVRYTQRGDIELLCTSVGKDKVIIHIRDTGIGILPEDFEKIFEEFVQLNNPERDRSKGLGLGLAIVRRLAELLDHPLTVASEPNVGSEFSIELPLGEQSTIETFAPSLTNDIQNALEGLIVMVVDNEIEIIDAMQLLLQGWGCKVLICSTTEHALALIADGEKLDFIISDYRMPGDMNGIEFIRAIRTSQGEVPGLIISGDTSKDILRIVKEHGLFLLHKPIRSVQLHMAITQILAKSTE